MTPRAMVDADKKDEIRRSLKRWFRTRSAHRIRKAFLEANLKKETIECLIKNYEVRLDVESAGEPIKSWWNAVLRTFGGITCACIAEAIASRGVTLAVFGKLFGLHSPPDLLKALDSVDGELYFSRYSSETPSAFSDVEYWTDSEIRDQYCHAIQRLVGSENAIARRWLLAIDGSKKWKPSLALRLTEELLVRGVSLYEFYACCCQTVTGDVVANLHFLDYLRRRRKLKWGAACESVSSEDARYSPEESYHFNARLRSAPFSAVPRRDGFRHWTKAHRNSEGPDGKVASVSLLCGLEVCSQDAKDWWGGFCVAHRDDVHVVLAFADELYRRGVTIGEFHSLFAESRTQDIQATLHFLDYLLAVQREEKMRAIAQEKNSVGNGGGLGNEPASDPN